MNKGRDFNYIYGKYGVRYPDGNISEPMCLDTARNYASIFGGAVIRQKEKIA